MDVADEGILPCILVLTAFSWLISKNEHEELVKANPNVVKIGWNPNKLNCCSTHKYLHVPFLLFP